MLTALIRKVKVNSIQNAWIHADVRGKAAPLKRKIFEFYLAMCNQEESLWDHVSTSPGTTELI